MRTLAALLLTSACAFAPAGADENTVVALQASATAPGQTTIYFVRHADTAKDSRGGYVEKFTPEGEAQVKALPEKLDLLAPKFDVILVSPAWRAMNTIRPYLERKGQVAQVVPELNESSYSNSDSSPPREDSKVRIDDPKYFKLADPTYGALLAPGMVPKAPGSEAGGKLVSFLDQLIRNQFSGKRLNVLVVGHYHTGGRLLKALQGGGVPAYDQRSPVYQPANGAVSILKQDCSGPNFILVQYNDDKDFNGKPLPQGSPDFPGKFSFDCAVARSK